GRRERLRTHAAAGGGTMRRGSAFVLPAVVLIAWELASASGWLSTRVLPEPLAVLRAFWTLSLSGEIWHHVAVSTWRALSGFSLGFMWVILIVAETISAQAGIGYMTMNAREFLQTDVVLVGILLYALLGKLADLLSKGLERWWLRWHPGYQAADARA